MGPEKGDDGRVFSKDSTVLLNVGDNQRVKAMDVINSIEIKFGKGAVYACVPKAGDCFEVTVPNKVIAEKLLEGVVIGEKLHDCSMLYSDITVVSFMHLPAYVTDREITDNLTKVGIESKSYIKRRYHRGTRCADGTRFLDTKFPPNVKSLNYLMKFNTVYGPQMFKVKHNNQTKVCLCCYSDEHFIKQCPEFKCFQCGVQGHSKRDCVAEKCTQCYRYPVKCQCSTEEQMYDIETEDDEYETDDDIYSKNDSNEDSDVQGYSDNEDETDMKTKEQTEDDRNNIEDKVQTESGRNDMGAKVQPESAENYVEAEVQTKSDENDMEAEVHPGDDENTKEAEVQPTDDENDFFENERKDKNDEKEQLPIESPMKQAAEIIKPCEPIIQETSIIENNEMETSHENEGAKIKEVSLTFKELRPSLRKRKSLGKKGDDLNRTKDVPKKQKAQVENNDMNCGVD